MSISKQKAQIIVRSILDAATMKFRPRKVFNNSKQWHVTNILAQLQSKVTNSKKHQNEIHQKLPYNHWQRAELKYVQKLSYQLFLIGNENQLDLIKFCTENRKFVQTQFVWDFEFGKEIEHLCVDNRKSYFVVSNDKNFYVYKYDIKNDNEPFLIQAGSTASKIMGLQFAKQSILVCFCSHHFQVFALSEDGIKLKNSQSYKLTEQQAKIFTFYQVPPPYEQTIKVFFKADNIKQPTFNLSCVTLQFLPTTIKIDPLIKLYDIKNNLINSKLQMFSRQFVMMNLGSEIEILKDGYILDTINVNLQISNSVLKYLGNNVLLHLTDKKLQLYHFLIDKYSRPQKIVLKPIDSIGFNKPPGTQLFDAIQTTNGNFALFFQTKKQNNDRVDGQVIYYVTITHHVHLSSKLHQIFSANSIETYKKYPNILEQQIDIAQKMGLSKKEIFFQLWMASPKQSQKDESFLLATEDYQTISEQIQKKLKKKSISLKNLIMMEQSCRSMLRKKLQKECSEKIIKQYISCHFFYRKLKYLGNILKFQKLQSQENQQFYQSKLIVQHKKLLRIPQNLHNNSNYHQNQQSTVLRDEFKIFISIQQYLDLKEMNIKQRLIKLIDEFCQDQIDNTNKIKELLSQFKFIFRIQYRDILGQIIKTAKYSLVFLLKAFPYLLPYYPNVHSNEFGGVWGQIKNQWQSSLYLNTVQTIDNVQQIKQFINTVWFKRNKLKKHDLVTNTKKQIEKHIEKQNDQSFFYFFISKVIQQFAFQQQTYSKAIQVNGAQRDQLIKKEKYKNNSSPDRFVPTNLKVFKDTTDKNEKNKIIMKDIVNFLDVYAKMPQHLKGKVFLYNKLFEYLKKEKILPEVSGQPIRLQDFLKLKYPQLFKHFFKKQRNQKGLILKHIKSIFQSERGGQLYFNEAILNYFSDQMSEVSDLKYILNRINNEKKNFHQENAALCEIFVQAMMLKLKLGSKNDIPIQEVLIYIERLPIGNSQSIEKKKFILTLKEKSTLFKEMQLNMTLGDIYRNKQEVILRLTLYSINQQKIFTQADLQNGTYKCLNSVQIIKNQLYPDFSNYLHFYVYVCQLLKKQEIIQKLAKTLQNSKYLFNDYKLFYYDLDNIVLLMYRWKFNKDPVYLNNISYILKLTKILYFEQSRQWKEFLQSQMKLAQLLSAPDKPVLYPISVEASMPTINDFYRIIWDLPVDFLLQLNLEEVYKQLDKIETVIQCQIPVSPVKGQKEKKQTKKKSSADLYHIYQSVILKLIDSGEVKALKNIADKIIKLYQIHVPEKVSCCNNVFTIIYVLSIINTKSLSADCNRLLIEIMFYCLKKPLNIIYIIQKMFKQVLNHEQRKLFLYKQKEKLNPRGNKLFSLSKAKAVNPLFSDLFRKIIEKDQEMADYLIQQTIQKIKETKEEFMANFIYETVIRILLINPIILPKFLYVQKQSINWRKMRLLISYLAKFIIFDAEQLLAFSLKMFEAMRKSFEYHIYIEQIINDIKSMKIVINGSEIQIDNIINQIQLGRLKIQISINPQQPHTFDQIIKECSDVFLNKIDNYVKKKKENLETIMKDQAQQNEIQYEDIFNFRQRSMSLSNFIEMIQKQKEQNDKRQNPLKIQSTEQRRNREKSREKSREKKHKYPFQDNDDDDAQEFLTIKQIAPKTIPGFKHKEKKIKQFDLKKEMISIINKKAKPIHLKKNRQEAMKKPKQDINTYSVRMSSPGSPFQLKIFGSDKKNKLSKQKLQQPAPKIQQISRENSISYVQAESKFEIEASSMYCDNSRLGTNARSQNFLKSPSSPKNQAQDSEINISVESSNFSKSNRFKKRQNDSLGSDEKSHFISENPILDVIKQQGGNQMISQSPPTQITPKNNLWEQVKLQIPKQVSEKIKRNSNKRIDTDQSQQNSRIEIKLSMNIDIPQDNQQAGIQIRSDLFQKFASNRISPPPKTYEIKREQTQQKSDEKQRLLDALGNPPAINLNQTSSYFSNNQSIGSSFEEAQQKIIQAFIEDNEKFLKLKPSSEEQKVVPNLVLLQHLKKNSPQNFVSEAKQLLNKIYQSSIFADIQTDKKSPSIARPLECFFDLLRIIHFQYPQIGLNIFWIQAYKQGIQKYASLPINCLIRKFLVFRGVYSWSKTVLDLYQQLEQDMVPYINENNFIKIATLMALALKQIKLQSLLYLSYIKKLIKQLITQYGTDSLKLSAQKQKDLEHKQLLLIQVTKKINGNFLLERFQELFRKKKKCALKNQMMQSMCEILQGKLQEKQEQIQQLLIRLRQ